MLTKLALAPMEGVIDHTMRAMLTSLCEYDRCVTEFLRVTDRLLPERVFFRICPELHQDARTPNGTPVFLQLLGSSPEVLAQNALRAVQLGAPGIDLNFGCPAKTVNKSQGGASVLRTPTLVGDIVSAVRQRVPSAVPVTAKIRLGFDHDQDFEQIINELKRGEPTEITIHARTKAQGYRPPAHWHKIKEAAQMTDIPIVANGEIWSVEDARACLSASSSNTLMLARGALMRPDLGRLIKQNLSSQAETPLSWPEIGELLLQYFKDQSAYYDAKYTPSPVKQWLVYLKHYHGPAALLFEQIKKIRDPIEFGEALNKHLRSTAP